jgi:hypothetical protein
MEPVTDPDLISQLNQHAVAEPVTDPALISQLENGSSASPKPYDAYAAEQPGKSSWDAVSHWTDQVPELQALRLATATGTGTKYERFRDQVAHGLSAGLTTEARPIQNYASAKLAKWLGRDMPDMEGLEINGQRLTKDEISQLSPEDIYHITKQHELAKIAQGREEFGALPQIAGGVLPFVVAPELAASKTLMGAIGQGAKVGAITGGIGGATGSDESLGQRAGEAAKGAGLGAGFGGAGGGLGYGIGAASGIVGRAVADARNPVQAANRRLGEAFEDANIPLEDVRAKVAPSSTKKASDEQITEMVRRAGEGQNRAQIAREMGLTPGVVASRLAQFESKTRVPINMVDAAKLVAQEAGRTGADLPVTETAQTAAAFGKKGARIAAERLAQRHVEQPGRIADIFEGASKGPPLADYQAQISDVLDNQKNALYKTAEDQAQPFDLSQIIKDYRGQAYRSAGDIKAGLSKAIDLFYKPGYAQATTATGAPRYTKFLGTITDLPRYQAAKQALDQDIASSLGSNSQPTPLTRVLTKFRQDVDAVVKDNNEAYAEADRVYGGARSNEKIIDMGQQATVKAGQKQSKILDYFHDLNKDQQELFRASFKNKLVSDANNATAGGANPARQYTSKAAQDFLNEIFPGKEGDRLLADLAKENVTVSTLNDIFRGSRTAPLMSRMNEATEGAQMVGDLVTGNAMGVARRVGQRLATGMRDAQAEALLERATNPDPKKMLPYIEDIAAAQKYNQGVNQRISQRAGTGAATGAFAATNIAKPALFPHARQARDGYWYVPDPNRPGRYLQVRQ